MEQQLVTTLFVSIGCVAITLCVVGTALRLAYATRWFRRPWNTNTDETTCYVCMAAPASAILLECGHVGICLDCAVRLCATTRRCPLCRKYISRVREIEITTVQ